MPSGWAMQQGDFLTKKFNGSAWRQAKRLDLSQIDRQPHLCLFTIGEAQYADMACFDLAGDGVTLVPNEAEQVILHEISDLRGRGWTLRRIAGHLNAKGVKTKSGGASWAPQTIATRCASTFPSRRFSYVRVVGFGVNVASRPSSTNCFRTRSTVARPHPRAAVISGSDLASPPSAWSANSRIRERTNFRAAAFPTETNDRNS